MKRHPYYFLILISLSLLHINASAQVSKGQWTLGGYGYINPDRYISVQISPTANYFISNKFAVGAIMNIGYANYEYGHTFNSYLIPTIRCYFGKSRTQPFILAGYGINQYYSKWNESKNNEFSTYGGAGLGVSHLVNNNVALEAIAGYSNSPITIYRGIFFNLGFQIFLTPRKNEEQ